MYEVARLEDDIVPRCSHARVTLHGIVCREQKHSACAAGCRFSDLLENGAGPELLPVEDPGSLFFEDSLQVLRRALCLTRVAEEYVEARVEFAAPGGEALFEVRTCQPGLI